jgi:chemotaxis protein methyltransferase CheR
MVPEVESGEESDRVPFVQEPVFDISDPELDRIRKVLLIKRGFNLTGYKDNCVKRRIAIRIRATHCQSVRQYCDLLDVARDELDKLLKVLTIHVSQFFRNFSAFEILRTEIIPELFARARIQGRTSLRFWSLGCAGGEEAYSLAIILREFFARELLHTQTEIRASDIDADILKAAEQGEYNEDRLKDLPDSIRERYFFPNASRVQLSAKVREMVTFHQQNIMDVDAYEACHLVLCRNTLIYFNRPDQEKILRDIAYILPTGGILVLGKSESLVGGVRTLFTAICPVERIFRRL